MWCDERANGIADGRSYCIPDDSTDGSTDGSTDACTDGISDACTDRNTVISTDGLTDRHADTAPLRRRHALLLAQHA